MAGLSTAKTTASSVAVQKRRRPLCGEQCDGKKEKKYASSLGTKSDLNKNRGEK